jgi:hypothetical protein
VLAGSPEASERELFLEAWRRTVEAVERLSAVHLGHFAGSSTTQARARLASAEGQSAIRDAQGSDALQLAQATIGYGMPVFELATRLLKTTDFDRPDPDQELFRRFMFLTFRGMRRPIFESLDSAGWERLADAVDRATMVRLDEMSWTTS